ncbi:MAG: type IV pilus secretin PilQ [Thermodesulfobacteriota bacterium]
MGPRDRRLRPGLMAMALYLALALLASACAKQERTDPFVEKWKRMAEQSQGHSPAPTPPAAEEKVEAPELLGAEQVRPKPKLPTSKVSLTMYNVDTLAVLQTLARSAGVSAMISPGVAGSKLSVNIENKPWDQVFVGILHTNGLRYDWEGDILRVMTLEDLEHDMKVEEIQNKRQALAVAGQQVEPLYTSVVKVKYADAKSLSENLVKFLTTGEDGKTRGSVVLDPHTNALVIQAGSSDVRRLVKLVGRLDRPSAQVRLKAHIVETTTETARALGVQWGGQYARAPVGGGMKDGLFVTPGATSTYDPTAAAPLTRTNTLGTGGLGNGLGMNFPPADFPRDGAGAILGLAYGTIGGNLLELQLSALQQDDKLKILSSPSITTLDNQTAFTENGAKVPYASINADGQMEVKFEDAVLRLEMTPHIIDDEHLKLKILVKKDEVDTSNTVQGNPFIVKKQTETTLISRNNETIVISGLTRKLSSESERGLPGLKDVPALGWLFKGQNKGDEHEEVLIFITPTILDRWKVEEVQKTLKQIEQEIEQENEQKDKG